MRMYNDPKGEAYKQVIDTAIRNSEYVILGEKNSMSNHIDRSQYAGVLEAMDPYLLKRIVIQGQSMDEVERMRETYRSEAFYTKGTYYIYKCCDEIGDVLKRAANRLSDWKWPNLPEDLCFLKEEGGDYLYSVVHEDMYGLNVNEDEAIELMDRIPGLFLELEAHQDLNRLLDDAIKQQAEQLYISGHGLTELPERIQELTELRQLNIFEQDLYRLPEELFELRNLESLSIMTADLECIPASVAKLENLKSLSICCGSSDRPLPGWKAKLQKDISLNQIPPEIGQLVQLERLAIRYSSIRELPLELEKLSHLKYLDLGMSMITKKPEFLNHMKQLVYVNVSMRSIYEEDELE